MKKQFPSTDYPFAYKETPKSGNSINGVGESRFRRATQIFHGSGARELEWRALEQFFALSAPFKVYWLNLVNRWLLRNADGRVAPIQQPVDDADEMAASIKAKALEFGAGTVGITKVREHALYQNYDCKFESAIVVLMPMSSEEMSHIADVRSGVETMRVYMEISKTVISIAKHIRGMGWSARAYGESADILHIPLAIDAGLGQLGKHGSLICKEYGSNLRIATVLTNMPLTEDAPVDIAVDDLCIGCKRCTIDCPPGAITDSKIMVRGVEKWYVDFDKCVPYFTHTVGCGICIEVCPWSKPGRGPGLSEKLLSKRT
ncbi:MAG: 4Fe-4S dicluster domain-containing protein [Pseudomonadales bacterium]